MSLRHEWTFLKAAIQRNENELDRMGREAGTDCPCCFGAAYGGTDGPYDKLERKLDRQYARLKILDKKLLSTI